MRIRVSSLIAAAAVSLTLTAAPSLLLAQAKTSVCKDGTTSTTSGKGACSGHGGVDAAKTQAAAKTAKADAKPATKAATTPPVATAAATKSASPAAKKDAPAAAKKDAPAKKDVAAKSTASDKDPAGATAECKDGTYSHASSHRGACSNHGGVAKFLK